MPLLEVLALFFLAGIPAALVVPWLGRLVVGRKGARTTSMVSGVIGAAIGVFAASEIYARTGMIGPVALWYAGGAIAGTIAGVLGQRRRARLVSVDARDRLRWFQFGMRALLLLTTAAAVVLTLGMKYVAPGRAEQRAIAAVQRAGGSLSTRLIAPTWRHPEYVAVDAIWLDRSTGPTDELLRDIGRLSHLKTLFISSEESTITDEGLKYLQGLRSLEELTIRGVGITDAGLAYLRHMARLRVLQLPERISDAGLAHLKRLTDMEQLSLHNAQITTAGLTNLKELSNLFYLDLSGSPIDDAALKNLKGLTKLRFLRLDRTNVTADGVDELTKALPNLNVSGDYRLPPAKRAAARTLADMGVGISETYASFRSIPINQEVLKLLKHWPDLTWVDLSHTQVTDTALDDVKHLAELETLLLENTLVTDGGLGPLISLPNLKNLSLAGTRVGDVGFHHVAQMTLLEFLNLTATQVTSKGLEQLKPLTKLKHLWLDNIEAIDDTALEHLSALVSLEQLHLGGTTVSDAGLRHLEKLTNLKNLSLEGTKVTPGGVEALKKALPGLGVSY